MALNTCLASIPAPRSALPAIAAALLSLAAAAMPMAATAQTSACLNVGGAFLCSDIGSPAVQVQASQLQSGMYEGYWHDGRAMVERVTVTANEILLYRVAGGDVQGQTFRYIRSGASTYNSSNGHTIFITGPTSFTWTNSGNRNGVSYQILQ